MHRGAVRAGIRRDLPYALALMLFVAAGSIPAAAQQTNRSGSMLPERGLQFGQLIPGVPQIVKVGDTDRRAELVLRGEGSVQVMLILPDQMTSPNGARMPVQFGEADAAIMPYPSAAIRAFNPRLPTQVTLASERGDARLYLGGTVYPGRDQAAGAYSASIVVLTVRPDS